MAFLSRISLSLVTTHATPKALCIASSGMVSTQMASETLSVSRQLYRIIAGQIFDSFERKIVRSRTITVDRNKGIILSIEPHSPQDFTVTEGVEIIDLRHLTVLPGFVDVHVHCASNLEQSFFTCIRVLTRPLVTISVPSSLF